MHNTEFRPTFQLHKMMVLVGLNVVANDKTSHFFSTDYSTTKATI